jgi:hypothetical protein
MFNFLRCFISHDWEIIERGEVKLGPHFIFWSWGHQEGTRECKRCRKIENVYRSGLIGEGCDVIEWRRQ